MTEKTRVEHIAWCKERAIAEMQYSHDPKQGVISIMSDLQKHPETNGSVLQMICMATLMNPLTEQQARDFINGFN